ncbi:chloramphenicol O-acetyltransferase type A [Agromyces sp. CF514]|uniref:CatA-like O-acetyltransferase n=1 Tax=Agromyces sp. CF514 TaxID=1881031 RepID=UPI0008ED3FAA|nr:CatA-like O-acetyltransferase [Agromyces sp. CF514]SFR71183.1 chloramphenicol O-acetyltransferase type A [Agromyces sp. CF514]
MTTPAPVPVDLETWPRRETFEYYRHQVPCTYAITVELDVTAFVAALRQSTKKTYPAQIWAIANIVNRHPEFRMTLTDEGAPAVWPVVHPAFTVFQPERETFAAVSVAYDADFAAFHAAAVEALASASHATGMFPQGELRADAFDISSLPWTSFTGFTLNIDGGSNHFAPIFTLGRYVERDGRTLLPLALQIHHASADGFHTSRLLRELEELLAEPSWLG